VPPSPWGWLISPEELASWVLSDDGDVLAVNKPAGVLCHPSKRGPWSSLIGACREHFGAACLHMPSRLDRETSGIVVLARNRDTAHLLQTAIERHRVRKTYLAVLCGTLAAGVVIDQPIGPAEDSLVAIRRAVRPGGQPARTEFVPLASNGRFTLCRVHPHTGRLHQIRIHAAWLGHPVAGDKIYGPDETLFLEFLRDGYTARLTAALPLPRQALHASEIVFETADRTWCFAAPLTADLVEFCARQRLSPSASRT
jgi:23S rRNA pseudouridine1911/1915/1917 synthase